MFFRRWRGKLSFLICKSHSVFELCGGLRVKNPSVFDDFIKYFLGGAQRAPKIDFGGLWGLFESPLGSPFGHVGGSVLGIIWVQNGARHVNMRVLRAILAQVEVARGSQKLSRARFWKEF